MRVLYVDDDRINALLFEETVRFAPGVEIETAGTGAEALDLAQRWQPDLLVVDLHLPDANGLELLSRLRAAAGRPGWRGGLSVHRRRCARAGARSRRRRLCGRLAQAGGTGDGDRGAQAPQQRDSGLMSAVLPHKARFGRALAANASQGPA